VSGGGKREIKREEGGREGEREREIEVLLTIHAAQEGRGRGREGGREFFLTIKKWLKVGKHNALSGNAASARARERGERESARVRVEKWAQWWKWSWVAWWCRKEKFEMGLDSKHMQWTKCIVRATA
jgi:hypothetical protein